MSSDLRADEGARVSVAAEMAPPEAEGGNDGVVTKPPPPPSCPVCMEPWTCNGAHRICCIPCGHVYGRSCLERWLDRCGNESAKCPQCGEQYEDDLIRNLYAPGNLWDGCCRLQEVKAHYQSKFVVTVSMIAEQMKESESDLAELRAKLEAQEAKMMADCESDLARLTKIEAGVMAIASVCDELEQTWREQFAQIERRSHEQVAMANANLVLMKERMKKMAEEEKAAPRDLIEFMERNCPQLSPFPNPFAPEKRRRRRSRPQLPPIAEPPGPAVKRTRPRRT